MWCSNSRYVWSSLACFCSSCRRILSFPQETALISADVAAHSLSVSYSASISGYWGVDTRYRNRASRTMFRVPLIHSALKFYAMILLFRHWSREFSISSRQWLFKIETRGVVCDNFEEKGQPEKSCTWILPMISILHNETLFLRWKENRLALTPSHCLIAAGVQSLTLIG